MTTGSATALAFLSSTALLSACHRAEETDAVLTGETTASSRDDRGSATEVFATPVIQEPAPTSKSPDTQDSAAQDAVDKASQGQVFSGEESVDLIHRAKEHLAALMKRGIIRNLYNDADSVTASPDKERFFVQVGSHFLHDDADTHRRQVRVRFTGLLSDLDLRVQQAVLPSLNSRFRVQIGPMQTRAAAHDLCRALKRQNQDCFTIAEKGFEREQGAATEASWASIGPNEREWASSIKATLVRAPQTSNTSQMADAAPLYTTPGLPGVLE